MPRRFHVQAHHDCARGAGVYGLGQSGRFEETLGRLWRGAGVFVQHHRADHEWPGLFAQATWAAMRHRRALKGPLQTR